jgi:hypothetical protein
MRLGAVRTKQEFGTADARKYTRMHRADSNANSCSMDFDTRQDTKLRCVIVSLIFQHGESAENTVITEKAFCFPRNHRPIGLAIEMHRYTGPGLLLNFNAPRRVEGLRHIMM